MRGTKVRGGCGGVVVSVDGFGAAVGAVRVRSIGERGTKSIISDLFDLFCGAGTTTTCLGGEIRDSVVSARSTARSSHVPWAGLSLSDRNHDERLLGRGELSSAAAAAASRFVRAAVSVETTTHGRETTALGRGGCPLLRGGLVVVGASERAAAGEQGRRGDQLEVMAWVRCARASAGCWGCQRPRLRGRDGLEWSPSRSRLGHGGRQEFIPEGEDVQCRTRAVEVRWEDEPYMRQPTSNSALFTTPQSYYCYLSSLFTVSGADAWSKWTPV